MTHSGLRPAAFAAMHGPELLYLTRDPWPWGKPHETAGIHRTSRQGCSRMAVCGARAADSDAGDRVPGSQFPRRDQLDELSRVATAQSSVRQSQGDHTCQKSLAPASHHARAWNVAPGVLSETRPVQTAGARAGAATPTLGPSPFLV